MTANPADRDPVLMAVADGLETTEEERAAIAVRAARAAEAWSDKDLGICERLNRTAFTIDGEFVHRLLRDIDRLLSERHRAEEAKWLPMDSAPKDGTRVLVAWKAFAGISDHVELGKWKQRDGWCNTYGKSFHGIPDYFMPLPALPLTPEPTHER